MVTIKGQNSGDESERKMPEFIYIEDPEVQDATHMGSTPQDEPHQIFGSIQSIAQGQHPFYLRVLSLFGSVFIFIISFLILAAALVYTTLSLLLFRRSAFLNQQATSTWGFYKKALVFMLGSFIMTFNLSFGVGIVLMYLMLRGENIKGGFYSKFVKDKDSMDR